MRKIIIIFLILLISLNPLKGENKNYILLAGDYKFPPFEYLDKEGNPVGFSVDIVEELSRKINKKIVIKLMPWKDALTALREGKVDGIELMRITEERKKEFDFIPYIENYSVIVVKRDSNIQNFMDLKGKKISCLNMDVAHNFLLGMGEVIPKLSSEEVLRAVLKGEAEAGVVNYYFARWIINKNEWQNELKILPDKLFTNYSGIALPKGSPLFDELKNGITKVLGSPTYKELLKKWFGEEIILKEKAKEKEITSLILIFISALIFLSLLGTFISRRYLKREVYRQTIEIKNLLEENKKRYDELNQVYNFLKESASLKDLEFIEDLFLEKLKVLCPNAKIKYFKKINGEFLLIKSYPEEKSYLLNLEEVDKIEGEKYLFKEEDKILSLVVLQGEEIRKNKNICDFLAKEFESILFNLETQRKLRKSQEISRLLDIFSIYKEEKFLILEEILKNILQIVEGDAGSIMSYSEEDGLLRIITSVNLSPEVVEKGDLRLGEESAGWVAQYRKPLILNDGKKICYPLVYENRLIGVLNINTFKEHKRFISEDFVLLEKVASLLSTILYREKLEEKVKTLNREALFILVEAIDARDPHTGGHSREVRNLSLKLGKEIGLKEEDLKILEYASYLHDVGKIKVPDFILRKPGKLDEEEFNIIKMHTIWGEELVKNFSVFRGIEKIIRHHHERWDGGGYPDGLKGEDIPLFSRIIALADSFQAMTSFRPYKKKLSIEEAIKEIGANKGRQFDPYLSDIFIKIILAKYKK